MPNLPADAAIRSIETLLYSISNVLYLPVLLGIAALTLYMLVCFGTFGAEWLERRRGVSMLVATARHDMAAVLTAQEGEPGLDARLERVVQ
ncbi:MAG TPA: MotA/TolQ/ExbB proton channel family protein, partial [Duganella sp.]|nr:MotA/TolQ/ExbB proton channel family protein [Duganella sp.]